MKYIGIGDFFLIAEAVLSERHGPRGHSARELNRATDPQRVLSVLEPPKAAIDGVELYPSLVEKAAVLCIRIARNRPLPYDNEAVAYLAMVEFVERNGAEWIPPADGADEVVSVIEAMAAGAISEADFVLWVGERVA
jgi:death on curing protein